MLRTKTFLCMLCLGSLFLAGCGENEDPNLAKNPAKSEVDAALARRSELVEIYKRAGGQWENLTPDDKKRVLELSNGNEAMAQQGWPTLAAQVK